MLIAGSLRIETFEGSRPHLRLMGFESDPMGMSFVRSRVFAANTSNPTLDHAKRLPPSGRLRSDGVAFYRRGQTLVRKATGYELES
jgi:hypothetical protein